MPRWWPWAVAVSCSVALLMAITVAIVREGLEYAGWLAAVLALLVVPPALVGWARRRSTQRERLGDRFVAGPRDRLPRVRDLVRVAALDHRFGRADARADEVPFIRRDASREVEEALKAGGFVLVTGESTSGKTRAAFEAMRACLSGHVVVAPYLSEDVRQAVELARRHRPSVLWLDDVERYLGGAKLTVGMVDDLLQDGEIVILATIRTVELEAFGSRADAADPDERETEYRRVGRQLLGRATWVPLPLQWSEHEVARANAAAGDDRVADALAHADEFGVAEYLAAGPQLLEDWRAAHSPSSAHLRGWALVAAAVDVRRAGYTSGVTLDFLRPLHDHYLRGTPYHAISRPEPWEEAVAWAVHRPYATTSMLIPQGDGLYRTFDYLMDAVQEDPRKEVWDALIGLLDGSDLAALLDVGSTAYDYGMLDAAEQAVRLVADKDEGHLGAEARATLGLVLEARADAGEGSYTAARHEYRRAVDSGWPEAVAQAQMRLGILLAKLDEREESVKWLKLARDSGHSWYGGRASRHLGYWLEWWGEVAQAQEAFEHTIDHGHPRQAIKAMIAMGDLLAGHDSQAAADAYRRAMDAGDPELATAAALYLGVLLNGESRRQAHEAMERAAGFSDEHGDPWLVAAFEFMLNDYAGASEHTRLAHRAARSLRRLEQIAAVGHPRVAPLALVYLGIVRRADGDEIGARAAWTQALASGHQPAHELAGELLAESGSADA
ncbi:hypothetical protein [Nonomuraea angiospora]|uniref:hypothetical protein n=1 Tax=Nonomuraea angiospora TaxID=46172 RepID=UPI0029B7568B|nr:hypothetical protein [Nonomuraea angiospora]MDX3104550.1 hypothetical protein [Nonomuraea angiospora]